jgi:hypothetical protein
MSLQVNMPPAQGREWGDYTLGNIAVKVLAFNALNNIHDKQFFDGNLLTNQRIGTEGNVQAHQGGPSDRSITIQGAGFRCGCKPTKSGRRRQKCTCV